MKITYLHQHFKRPDEAGGTRSWEFARRLADDGHVVTMICGGPDARRYELDGFSVIQLAVPYSNGMSPGKRIASFLRFGAAATVAAIRDRADVVFASSTPLTVAVPGMVAASIWRSKFVLEVRDLWPEAPIALGYLRSPILKRASLALERTAYRHSQSVIALSPGMSAGVKLVSPSTKVVVVPNASDIDMFDLSSQERRQVRREHGWDDGRPVIVYAGSLGAIYDPLWLLDFAVEAREVGVRVVVIGDGSGRDEVAQSGRRRGIDVDEIFLGPRPKTDVARYVAGSDAVLSSVISNPVLEAASINKVFDGLAASRPVLLNHGGWLTDRLVREGAGWFIGDRSAHDAAILAARLLSDSERLRSAQSRAFSLAKEVFNRDLLYADFRRALTVDEF